jgi:hypothetical protein
MAWRRLSVLAFSITLLIFAGVARGQDRYELPEQGPQPLQSDLANPEQPGLADPQSIDESNSNAKDQKAPGAAGIKKSAKGASPKPYSFGPATGQYGVPQARGLKIGSSPGSTSFLDGYLLKSLHDDGLARKKPMGEDKPKDDLLLPDKTSSKF